MKNLSAIDIGNRIGKKLTELNLRQKDLVSLTDLSKNAISNYISGNRIPDTNSIYKIAIALHVSTDWLLLGDDILTTENLSSTTVGLSRDEVKILKLYNLMNRNDSYLDIVSNLTDQELNFLNLYKQLDENEKIKIEGAVEMKIAEAESSATQEDLA